MADLIDDLGRARSLGQVAEALFQRAQQPMLQVADEANNASTQAFPGQDWDNTQRNAARHSIWTGLMTQGMGGGTLGGAIARGLGHLNEALSLYGLAGKSGVEDTKHDLNNNLVGIQEAQRIGDMNLLTNQAKKELLIQSLLNRARQSQPAPAPDWLAPVNGQLTRGQ